MKKERGKEAENLDLVESDEEKELVATITDSYRASYIHKDDIGMNNEWAIEQDYWAGDVNEAEDEDDPASETNIVQSIIESQVADLVDGTMEMMVKGGPSEQPYVDAEKQRLKWIWYKNDMTNKLDESERDRLNLGTVIWKQWYDFDAYNGRGCPIMDPLSPDAFFPDPKIKVWKNLNMGDFCIHVLPYPLKALRRRFGERGKLVQPEGQFRPYNPHIFGEDDADGSTSIINDQALLYEYWDLAEDDDDVALRRIYMCNGKIMENSDWTHKTSKKGRRPFYKHNEYPFVPIVCYKKKGRLWGLSDTKQLIPIQDMINDMDDQIRMNARLMGNIQMVVGLAAGINLKKWTNKPGLKIPAKDHTAFKEVQPPNIPAYIPQRRQFGFQESEMVSGRSDVTEGRRSGSLRAASAIMALQEAGSRRANHKKLMLQQGFVKIMEQVASLSHEFMDNEQDFDIEEGGKTKLLWSKPTDMNAIPVKTLNENFNPASTEEGTGVYKDLQEEEKNENGEVLYDEGPDGGMIPRMKTMTKEAEFKYEFSFGAGMPNNPSFVYQATLELHRENIITQPEARKVLKGVMNWPIIDANSPDGNFAGRNNSAEQLAIANGQSMQGPQGAPQGAPQGQQPLPFPSSVPQPGAEMAEQGQQISPDQAIQMFMMAIDALPPEIVQALIQRMGAMAPAPVTGGGLI